MATSRRRFLKSGTLVALMAGVPATISAKSLSLDSEAATKTHPSDALSHLDMQAFSRQLNTEFFINNEKGKRTSVRLVEVRDYQRGVTKGGSRKCFSAVFLGAARPGLRQETYAIEHKVLGKFNLLIVPVEKVKDGQYYEAVFNRLH